MTYKIFPVTALPSETPAPSAPPQSGDARTAPVFKGQMPSLSPNKQWKSTEGNDKIYHSNITIINCYYYYKIFLNLYICYYNYKT